MNLAEFLNHQSTCPFCLEPLVTGFVPNRKQTVRYEEGRLVVLFDMNALQKIHGNYKVGYSFGLTDNSFQIEFYTGVGTANYYDNVPLHLIEKFRDFDKAMGASYAISRHCKKCYHYSSGSQRFGLNFRTQSVDDGLELGYELFMFVKPTEDPDKAKVMVLSNKYYETMDGTRAVPSPSSQLHYYRGHPSTARYDHPYPQSKQRLILPFIPFVSPEETGQRLNNLIVFS